jgi:tetratricopeptide (TPR) repeat protein
MKLKNIKVYFFIVCIVFTSVYCNHSYKEKEQEAKKVTYLNHGDSAKYVGINTCKLCHLDIYNTFIKTGMGQSFGDATQKKSSANFTRHSVLYDKYLDLYYYPFWSADDSLRIKEYRLEGKDTIYKRVETVDYIVGSGQHTNSHIFNTNGYLHQMPMTFYTQDDHWDFPPGFENGFNSRFSRKIGLECMSCHNALPDFVIGSENKYFNVGNGINCERCHGPGSIHVEQKSAGNITDTSKYIDYSIVNPGKLPIDLQFDVCQRCHLQGNTVLKEGKSFYDFRPGMKLSDIMTVFLPRYEGAEKEFIMASHADRLKMSECFLKTFEPEKSKGSLRPYKEALTCVTCHNPHVSVKETGHETFNNACKNCHGNTVKETCSEKLEVRMKKQDNCAGCHMPRSGSTDIPHVTVTDHFIRKPVSQKDIAKVKKFIGLYAVNEKDPDRLTRAKSFIQQYEKFDNNPVFLDSAQKYLSEKSSQDVDVNFDYLVQLYFLKNNFQKVSDLAASLGQDRLLNSRLNSRSWNNSNAWTCYRIGESFSALSAHKKALAFYKKANELAPFVSDFGNKLGACLLTMGRQEEAKKVFKKIISEDPKFAPAWCNLGYVHFLEKDLKRAEEKYNRALSLNPDYEFALGNMISLLVEQKQYLKAQIVLQRMIKKNPTDSRYRMMEQQLKNMQASSVIKK